MPTSHVLPDLGASAPATLGAAEIALRLATTSMGPTSAIGSLEFFATKTAMLWPPTATHIGVLIEQGHALTMSERYEHLIGICATLIALAAKGDEQGAVVEAWIADMKRTMTGLR